MLRGCSAKAGFVKFNACYYIQDSGRAKEMLNNDLMASLNPPIEGAAFGAASCFGDAPHVIRAGQDW